MASESSTTPGETARRRRKERKEEKNEKEERKERKEKEKEEKETQTEDIEGLTSSGHRALQEGRTQDALQRFRRALKAARQLQDMRAQRACSLNLGAVYVETGRPRRGLELLQRAQPGPKAERLPDLQFNLALAHNALGQHREAAAHFLQAAQLYRSQGDGGSEGDACMEMSRCYAAMQDWTLAARGFLRAADGYRVAAMLDRAAAALQEAGRHMTQSDEFSRDDIIAVLTDCLSLTDSVTEPRTLGELYLSVGVAYCCLRCFPEAVSCLRRAEALASPWRPLLAQVLLNLGAALNSDRQFTAAVDVHRRAAALYGSLGCRGDQARCFSNLAFACSRLGDEEEAAESFVLALHGFRDTDDHVAQVEVCEALAECYLRQKKQHKAVQLYQEALTAAAAAAATVGQDDGGRVRGRLVERLTVALAPPTGPQQRPHPHRPRPPRPRPQDQGVRKSDVTQSPGPAANQQQEAQRGRGQAAAAAGRQEAAEHCGSSGGGDADGPTPHSPHLSDQTQHSELWSDRENPPTDSEASLVQEPEAPPPVRRWQRSRFCSLM